MTVQCTYCGCTLQEFDLEADEEGDDMWIVPLDDGEGGEAIICDSCYTNKQKQ
jgi:hypothetical protein